MERTWARRQSRTTLYPPFAHLVSFLREGPPRFAMRTSVAGLLGKNSSRSARKSRSLICLTASETCSFASPLGHREKPCAELDVLLFALGRSEECRSNRPHRGVVTDNAVFCAQTPVSSGWSSFRVHPEPIRKERPNLGPQALDDYSLSGSGSETLERLPPVGGVRGATTGAVRSSSCG
jgi:hypothetical protein